MAECFRVVVMNRVGCLICGRAVRARRPRMRRTREAMLESTTNALQDDQVQFVRTISRKMKPIGEAVFA